MTRPLHVSISSCIIYLLASPGRFYSCNMPLFLTSHNCYCTFLFVLQPSRTLLGYTENRLCANFHGVILVYDSIGREERTDFVLFHFLITSYIFRSNTLRIYTSKRSGIDYVEGKRGRHIFSYSLHILSARHSPPFFIELAP